MGYTQEEADAMRQRTEAAIKRGVEKHNGKSSCVQSPTLDAKESDEQWQKSKKDLVIYALKADTKSKRIKQDAKPLMNKLESDWFTILNAQFPNYARPRAQAKRYKIANGAWYKPDVTATSWPVEGGPSQETAWECKGPRQMKNIDRGMLTIKTAAHQWPEVRFVLVWKESGVWKTQHVLP
jgi:hypothetical protein